MSLVSAEWRVRTPPTADKRIRRRALATAQRGVVVPIIAQAMMVRIWYAYVTGIFNVSQQR